METSADVIIVGGGPVGLACALGFAQKKCSVIVLEKSEWPIDKACGEGIMPNGVDELNRLDVLSPDQQLGRPFHAIEIISSNGVRALATFDSGSGLGIKRVALSKLLFEKVKGQHNIRFCKAKVAHIEENIDHVFVHSDMGVFRAQFVVGADGLRSTIRDHMSKAQPSRKIRRYGACAHFAVVPWSRNVEVYFSNGIEAYVTPCSEDQVGIAFLWYSDRFLPKGGHEKLIEDCLKKFPALADKLEGVSRIGSVLATGPLFQSAGNTTSKRLALIGDAAGYFDAITGEGISLGLIEARILAEKVSPFVCSKDKIPKEVLTAFSDNQRSLRRWRNWKTRMTLLMARHLWLQKPVFFIFSRQPWLLKRFIG